MSDLAQYLRELTTLLVPLLLTITCHEAAHGLAASLLGDPTAKLAGRISLNPARHLDPFGFLIMEADGANLAPGDVAVLVRFRALIGPYKNALELAGVPCSAPETEMFWQEPRVAAILRVAERLFGLPAPSGHGNGDADPEHAAHIGGESGGEHALVDAEHRPRRRAERFAAMLRQGFDEQPHVRRLERSADRHGNRHEARPENRPDAELRRSLRLLYLHWAEACGDAQLAARYLDEARRLA